MAAMPEAQLVVPALATYVTGEETVLPVTGEETETPFMVDPLEMVILIGAVDAPPQ
jgi:hypothetical protein